MLDEKKKMTTRDAYAQIYPFDDKEYPFVGRLDVIKKDIRNIVTEANFVSVFGKTENEVLIKLSEEKSSLGVK